MSGNTVGAEWAALNTLESSIEDHVHQLDGQIAKLNGIVDNVKSSWKGQGANAYSVLQQQVNEDAKKLKQVLDAIRESVHTAKAGLHGADDDQSSRFQRLSGGGGDSSIIDALG